MIMVVLLAIAVFFVSNLISKDTSTPTVGTAKRVKASSQTYTKIIALGQKSKIPAPTETALNESGSPSPTEVASGRRSNSTSQNGLSPTINPSLSPSPTLSPTQTLLAKNISLTVSPSPNQTATIASSITVTAPVLPRTGYISNLIIIGIVSSALIFFSFLF